MLRSIVGTNWGDEGKGRMVDLLASESDIVVRYQGGNNAGHTVINERGKFILNLLPSGVFRDETVNIMGGGMVIDIEHLCGEMDRLVEKGVKLTPAQLKISDRAIICMPYHKMLDGLEEDRMGKAKQGSTRRGIGPVYSDKYMRKGIGMQDLLHPETLAAKVASIVEWKNLLVEKGYGQPAISAEGMTEWLHKFGDRLVPYICDTTVYLLEALKENKDILFEAQLGALRDIDYGIYPYTSSSTTLAAFAPIGAGIPGAKLDEVVGITKAYSSAVGGGPFTCELFGEEGDALREAGNEYGAATGRPRRVGGFDVVATRYGVTVQGASCIALTKIDVLSYLDKIPVCVAYDVNGRRVENFPTGDELEAAKPIYEYHEGWKCDISKCRKKEELPEAVLNYVKYIEDSIGCRVKYLSVGPERDEYIVMY